LKAVQLRARVALVEPGFRHDLIQLQGMRELSNAVGKIKDLIRFGVYDVPFCSGGTYKADIAEKSSISLDKLLLWGSAVAANIEEQLSPAYLAAQGVDVIIGKGFFQVSPDLNFIVKKTTFYHYLYGTIFLRSRQPDLRKAIKWHLISLQVEIFLAFLFSICLYRHFVLKFIFNDKQDRSANGTAKKTLEETITVKSRFVAYQFASTLFKY